MNTGLANDLAHFWGKKGYNNQRYFQKSFKKQKKEADMKEQTATLE